MSAAVQEHKDCRCKMRLDVQLLHQLASAILITIKMHKFYMLFPIGLVAVMLTITAGMDKIDSMTTKELINACASLSLEEMEAPLKWDLLNVSPPGKLMTKQVVLEFFRIRDNYETGRFQDDRANHSRKNLVR